MVQDEEKVPMFQKKCLTHGEMIENDKKQAPSYR